MRLIVPSKIEVEDWTPPSFVGQDDAPSFRLAYLDVKRRAEILDGMMYLDFDSNSGKGGSSKARMQANTAGLNTLIASIVGWKNIYDDTDKPVAFDGKPSTIVRVLTALQRNNKEDYAAINEKCRADSSADVTEVTVNGEEE